MACRGQVRIAGMGQPIGFDFSAIANWLKASGDYCGEVMELIVSAESGFITAIRQEQ